MQILSNCDFLPRGRSNKVHAVAPYFFIFIIRYITKNVIALDIIEIIRLIVNISKSPFLYSSASRQSGKNTIRKKLINAIKTNVEPINAGKIAEKLGVEGVLPEAEEIMAARDMVIAETNNIHAHICHISTKTSKNMIRDAKKRGVKITCETCPHYFSLTVEEVLKKGTNAKMNPPLREEKDRLAIIEGLKEGTIDCIITDHAPHSEEEKQKSLADAPNGIIGFETALPCEIMNLIDTGDLSYLDLVRVTSYNPAKLLGLDRKGSIEEGFDADLTIFDPNEEYVYTKDMIVSKAKNSPFIDEKLKGKVKYTIVGGRIVYEAK